MATGFVATDETTDGLDAPARPAASQSEQHVHEPLRRRVPVAVRMAVFYAVTFASMGISVPYWPVWLSWKGLDPQAIGVVMAAGLMLRLWANPIVGRLADRRGARRAILIGLCWASFGVTGLYLLADGFWPILAVTLLASLVVPPQVSLTENTGVLAAYQRGYDYGRVRLWGSVAFVGATMLAGAMLPEYGPAVVLWLMLAFMGAAVALSWLLPEVRSPSAASRKGAVRLFLRSPVFVLFLASTSLVNASHGLYYAFGALHWQAAGIDHFWIGTLWSEGVVAEIVLFAFSGRVVAAIGPARMIMLAALAGVLRWTLTGLTDSLGLLLVVQVLHAVTFGFCHLGAMHFVARAAPPDLSATAQGLYAATGTALVTALVTAAAGPAYARFGADAYFAMAGLCALAAIAALMLLRRWTGGTLSLGTAGSDDGGRAWT
jgi:PPP family 3-phenylpropionic acid transporter